jgi:uncharacterized RDD family membrane protein YckC
MNWYYVSAGKQTGPVDDAQLEALARVGQIQMDTLVWRDGMAEWQPFSTVAPPGMAAPAPVPAAPAFDANEVVCAECNRIFPKDETIPFGTVRVCAGCKPVFMQKLAEGATIGGQLRYATVLTRFGAVFLDGLILQAVNLGLRFALGVPIVESVGGPAQTPTKLGLQLTVIAVGVLLAASYEIFMIGKFGATLGKMACKVRVVTADGGKVGYGRATGRYFAKILSSLVCMIGFIMAFFDQERRALHDRICNTRVITIA